MSSFYFKTPEAKHPDHPSRDPDYADVVRAGKVRMKQMKFESEAHERDYMKQVNSNPNNVPGIAVYPSVGKIGRASCRERV